MQLIKLDSVSYENEKSILDSISLTLTDNSFATIIGPNGAGKTTLLKIILGLKQQTSGKVLRSPDLRIGYVPQKFYTDPCFPLRVKDFLNLTPNKDTSILDLTGIDDCLENEQLHTLSGGELQRVLLTYALLEEPNLLILDEPLQGLDVESELKLLSIIETIQKIKKIGVLLVSHDLHMVFQKSDYVICLRNHICCEGAPEFVQSSSEYLNLFPSQQKAVLAPYIHQHDHTHSEHCVHK